MYDEIINNNNYCTYRLGVMHSGVLSQLKASYLQRPVLRWLSPHVLMTVFCKSLLLIQIFVSYEKRYFYLGLLSNSAKFHQNEIQKKLVMVGTTMGRETYAEDFIISLILRSCSGTDECQQFFYD